MEDKDIAVTMSGDKVGGFIVEAHDGDVHTIHAVMADSEEAASDMALRQRHDALYPTEDWNDPRETKLSETELGDADAANEPLLIEDHTDHDMQDTSEEHHDPEPVFTEHHEGPMGAAIPDHVAGTLHDMDHRHDDDGKGAE